MKKLIGSACISLIVPALSWLGGYDFTERGPAALITSVWTLGAFVVAYTCPFWPEENRP